MSGLVLPPPEPPADDVDQVVELLRVARQQLEDVGQRLMRINAWFERGVALGYRDLMVTRVLVNTREREAELWAAEVAALEARARSLGLQP